MAENTVRYYYERKNTVGLQKKYDYKISELAHNLHPNNRNNKICFNKI